MQAHVLLLKALADTTRLKLFKLILHEELCVCELQDILGISQPAVSQHMARLKAVGLVRERRAGMWTYYQGDRDRTRQLLGAIDEFLEADPTTQPELSLEVSRRCTLNRFDLCKDRKEVRGK